jgi:hypothetical protein
MAGSERDRLRRLMGEAAALPPDDDFRREVEAEVSSAGTWVKEEWLALLRFDEEMRLALRRVPVPPQLKHALLTTADTQSRRRRFSWFLSRRVAAVMFVVLIASTALVLRQSSTNTNSLNKVALLAMSEHFGRGVLSVETRNPSDLERALADQIPFPVVLPDLGENFQLAGGQKCALAKHTVVYSLWRSEGHFHSLYQFQPRDFGLPDTIERTTVSGNGGCAVTVWTEYGRGYVLVANPSSPEDPRE